VVCRIRQWRVCASSGFHRVRFPHSGQVPVRPERL
jgi:hypothetical protein